MLATLATWAATQGFSLALGFLASVIKDAWTTYQANAAQREAGRLEAELAQSRDAERVQAELADQASKRVSDDDALARLERGDA